MNTIIVASLPKKPFNLWRKETVGKMGWVSNKIGLQIVQIFFGMCLAGITFQGYIIAFHVLNNIPLSSGVTQAVNQNVMCMIFTTASKWNSRAKAVRFTWSQRCHLRIFFYSKFNGFESHDIFKSPETVALSVPDGRQHLTNKTFEALKYAYLKFGNITDWFMKADDDVYVIWENLVKYLERYRSHDSKYIGRHVTRYSPKGYNSGGAGYIISKPAVMEIVARTLYCRENVDWKAWEDVAIGKCLWKFNIYPEYTLDGNGILRFHSNNPVDVLKGDQYLSSFFYINFNGIEFGNIRERNKNQMLSKETITIHYAKPEDIYTFDFLLYHLKKL